MLALAQLPPLGHVCNEAWNAARGAWRNRRARQVRSERELLGAIGNPLLAARPSSPAALRALADQLLEHWFTRGRTLLPVISAGAGCGRTALVVALAKRFAALGERTLVVDADFRAPAVHAAFRLANRRGLADLLDGRDVQMAACAENLAVMVAGRVREHPLELLSRERLRHFLAAAARRFRIVLVDTPAAERGPDLEMFAALASGGLLVVRPGEDRARLARLRRRLARCAAIPVAVVLDHPASVFSTS